MGNVGYTLDGTWIRLWYWRCNGGFGVKLLMRWLETVPPRPVRATGNRGTSAADLSLALKWRQGGCIGYWKT